MRNKTQYMPKTSEHNEQEIKLINKLSAIRITRKRDERVKQGICRDCGRLRDRDGVVCSRCRDTRTNYNRRRCKKRIDNNLCIACGQPIDASVNRKHCQICIDNAIQRSRLRRKKNRLEVIKFLGSCCVVCGETDIRVLTLDHVNGDGAEHKRSLQYKRARSMEIYAALSMLITKKQPIGRDLQLLCFNCHAKKDLSPWWLK